MIFNPLVPSLKKHLQCNNIEDEGHKFKLYGLFWSQIYNQFPLFLEHWWELKYASLFHDALAEDYESIAPYLVELPPDHEDLDDILRHSLWRGWLYISL